MRTTLSLDDDVTNFLNKEIRRSGMSFKAAVNHYLRLGLMTAKSTQRKPFVVTPIPVNLPKFDKVEELLETLEGSDYR